MTTSTLTRIPTAKLNIAAKKLSDRAFEIHKHNLTTYSAVLPNPCLAKWCQVREELDSRQD